MAGGVGSGQAHPIFSPPIGDTILPHPRRVTKHRTARVPTVMTRRRAPEEAMRTELPLIVFSHLRWDFVYQRPQHLLSRLAARRPVLFIEEPERGPAGGPLWRFTHPAPGVTVARPHTPAGAPGFCAEEEPQLRPMGRRVVV